MASALHTVDIDGRYDGLTLREALPRVVHEIVERFDPCQVVVFGSVARHEEGPDSDLDLMVVFEKIARSQRRSLMVEIRRAITTFVPVDIMIVDIDELTTDCDNVGAAVYWPLREGQIMYRRLEPHVG